MEIKVKSGLIYDIDKSLGNLTKMEVLVGIPQEKSSRPKEGDGITNAELLYIHTNGSPLKKIPARPVIEPAIEQTAIRNAIAEELKKAVQYALDGEFDNMKICFERAGMIGQNAARDWFTNPNNHWAPNKPSTIKGKGSSNPLIDTGEMRKAITYVVRDVNDGGV